jgi:hypothetical protein
VTAKLYRLRTGVRRGCLGSSKQKRATRLSRQQQTKTVSAATKSIELAGQYYFIRGRVKGKKKGRKG